MKPPCQNCTDRKIGCHGKCERYKEYREYQDKLNDKIRLEKNYGSFARQDIQSNKQYKNNSYKNKSFKTTVKIHHKSMGEK